VIKFMKNICILASFLYSIGAFCEPMKDSNTDIQHELRLSEIIQISDFKAFKAKITELHSLENRKDECEIQLRHEMLPTSCFEAIRLEKKLSQLSLQKYQETLAWLTENCIDRAVQLKEITQQRKQLRDLPQSCLEIVIQKMGDQHYRDITMNPVALFKKRF
jgi:hypothetical protein